MDWFRMYHEFATDAKVQSMSEAMQRRLMMLLCLKCSNTLVTLQDDEIAFALRISEEELAETKVLFMRKNFIDADWEIRQWDKRQFISDSSAARVAKHRAAKKQAKTPQKEPAATPCNVTVTPQIQNRTDTEQIQNNPLVDQKLIDLIVDPVPEIFAYWQKIMKSPKSVMDSKRKKIIAAALKLYSPGDVCKAIRGCSRSGYHMGDNKNKTKYIGLNLILRDAEYIDKFILLDDNPTLGMAINESDAEREARIIAAACGETADDGNTLEMEQ